MALEVPAREVNLGDCGFRGRGGGHRSGSELSHLFEVSRRKKDIWRYHEAVHWDQRAETLVRRCRGLMSQVTVPLGHVSL